MDLATFNTAGAESGSVMTVRNPITDAVLESPDGQPITITLAGSDSERFRKVQRANQNRRLKMQATRRGTLTSEEIEAEAIETLAACTIAWRGVVIEGEALECSAANARKAYKLLPWLREQVDAFVGDRSNFLKSSPST